MQSRPLRRRIAGDIAFLDSLVWCFLTLPKTFSIGLGSQDIDEMGLFLLAIELLEILAVLVTMLLEDGHE
jgi:hypothetical protein